MDPITSVTCESPVLIISFIVFLGTFVSTALCMYHKRCPVCSSSSENKIGASNCGEKEESESESSESESSEESSESEESSKSEEESSKSEESSESESSKSKSEESSSFSSAKEDERTSEDATSESNITSEESTTSTSEEIRRECKRKRQEDNNNELKKRRKINPETDLMKTIPSMSLEELRECVQKEKERIQLQQELCGMMSTAMNALNVMTNTVEEKKNL